MTKNIPIDLHPVQKLLDRHRIHTGEYDLEVDGVKLKMLPDVFCPAYTNTSKFLADNLNIEKDESVLDMFSGSGFVGIRAAANAGSVLCLDHSENAIKCIENNISANGLTTKVKSMKSDLFASLDSQQFDVIIANPPLLPGNPRTILETAVFDPELVTTVRFFEQVGSHLKDSGRIYLLFSDVTKDTELGGLDLIDRLCKKHNFTNRIVATKPVGYESYYVIEIGKET